MNAQQIRRTVVVGVDGSESALRAARWGAAEAGRRQLPLRLVLAFGWTPDHVLGQPGLAGRYRDVMLERAREQLAEAAAVAGLAAPGVTVEQQLVTGSPIEVLASEARRAQVVVIGDRGLSRIEGLLVGSVAIALVAGAPCPVVVVRGAERDPSETASLPVVVGDDGCPTGEAAIAFAFEAASARNVSLLAVHAWADLVFDPSMAMAVDWPALEAEKARLLAERLAGWAQKYPAVPVEQFIVRDSPAHSLLTRASEAQLVVVGSRGRGGLSGLVLGSVSNALVHRAPCPVVVVRPDPTEPV